MDKAKTIRKTSREVALRLISKATITHNTTILEPSAGSGDLVDVIKEFHPNVDVDCVELNSERRQTLKEKGYNLVGADFFKFETDKKYDYIIACPTYVNNIDVYHIMHMWNFLKDGGSIISLTSPYWTTRNNFKQVDFRKWLEDKEYGMNMLPDNSFIEKGDTQPSMIIKITK